MTQEPEPVLDAAAAPVAPPAAPMTRTDSRTSLADVNRARHAGGGARPVVRVDARTEMIERDRQRGLKPLPSAR